METEALGRSKLLNWLFKPAGLLMGSRARRWVMPPERTLRGADLRPGQVVLEVGCGTGFFTLPAARMLGSSGRLIAIDALSGFVDVVEEKIRSEGLAHVRAEQRDALKTELGDECIDLALLFGVLPWPALPLNRLLPEMHRVLKPDGRIAVWMFPVTGWVPAAIARSGLFSSVGKQNGVFNFRKIVQDSASPIS